mmetsp:Transcript_23507/g.41328  ORF Transcript_23507/g.41328 Transcript_23507/m.41328 type:complete len:185 (+) Transcript_23507:70-624(+)
MRTLVSVLACLALLGEARKVEMPGEGADASFEALASLLLSHQPPAAWQVGAPQSSGPTSSPRTASVRARPLEMFFAKPEDEVEETKGGRKRLKASLNEDARTQDRWFGWNADKDSSFAASDNDVYGEMSEMERLGFSESGGDLAFEGAGLYAAFLPIIIFILLNVTGNFDWGYGSTDKISQYSR